MIIIIENYDFIKKRTIISHMKPAEYKVFTIKLQNDTAKIYFGADNDVYLTHIADTGLVLDMAAEGSYEPEFTIRSSGNTVGSEFKLMLQGSTDNSTIGTIAFNAQDSSNNFKNYATIFSQIIDGIRHG